MRTTIFGPLLVGLSTVVADGVVSQNVPPGTWFEPLIDYGALGILVFVVLWWKRNDDQGFQKKITEMQTDHQTKLVQMNTDYQNRLLELMKRGEERETQVLAALRETIQVMTGVKGTLESMNHGDRILAQLEELTRLQYGATPGKAKPRPS